MDNDVIVIDKWYDIKSDLLPKNTIKRVDVILKQVVNRGFEKAKNFVLYEILLYGWNDSYLTDDRWTTFSDKKSQSGTNTSPCDEQLTTLAVNETLGRLTLNLDNEYGDTNDENYGVSNIKVTYRPTSGYSKEVNGFWGDLINTNGVKWSENYITPRFSFSGNTVTLTLDNAFIYGTLTYNWSTGGSDSYTYYPYIYSFTITYGGFAVNEVSVVLGDVNSPLIYEISQNGFYETHANTSGEELHISNANALIEKFSDGKQYVECDILCDKFSCESGEIVIDNKGKNKLVKVMDKVTFKASNGYVFKNPDGTPKVFVVLQANLIYEGVSKMKIKCLEE